MHGAIKVLMLVENNGYPRDFRVRREAQALRDAGYQVSVIAPREGREPWTECHDGVAVYRFPAPPGGAGPLSYAFEFGYATAAMLVLAIWVALRRGIDVVHAANPPDTLFVIGAVFKLLGKRYVFDHHDLAPEIYLSRFEQPRPNLIHACLRLLERGSYAVADVVIATNESFRRRALETGRKHPDQVFVVRNGPPLSYQALKPPQEPVEPAHRLIGYIGTIGPQDGVDYLMRAIAHIVHALGRTDVKAIVIGDGDALAQVRELAGTLRIEPHVQFTGWLSEREARQHLSTVDVCVQPDPSGPLNDKSTMNKLMEYMALGKPTVAFDLEETRYSAQEAACYVAPNDEEAYACQVVWLLDHPTEGRRMGEIGRLRVRSALAWEYSAAELVRAYQAGLELRPVMRPDPPRAAEMLMASRASGIPAGRRPSVTVVVPCYNYGHFLGDCVGSILAQDGVDVEVLIIDDASPDGSAEVAQAWARRDARVSAICHTVNLGHISTFNEGLAQARTDYVLLLSADDLLTPGALARATAVMEAHPNVGLVYGHPVSFSNLNEVQPWLRVRSWSVWKGERWITSQCRRGLSCIYSPEAVVRTSVQHRVGGYSLELPHTSDLEMWLRIALVSDVARVNGADQALRRLHGASMMTTQFGRVQDDLLQRHRAYERFFAGAGKHLASAQDSLRLVRQRLAQDALGEACECFRTRGEVPEVDELVRLARDIVGPLDALPAWRELRRLRMARGSGWDWLLLRAYAVMRNLDGRVRWRRWRYSGV